MSAVPKVTVRQGQIHVESVHALAVHPDAYVIHVDTRAKYPALSGMGNDMLALCADERTLRAEATEDMTVIEWDLPGEWHVGADTGRYDVYIYLVRKQTRSEREEDYALLWPPSKEEQ